MTERLRDIVASDDPAVADLARLVRAAGDPAPHAGAQDRVRRALAERRFPRRHRWQAAVVAVLVVFVVLPAAIAGVRWIAAPAPVPSPAAPAPVPSPAVPSSPRVAHRAPAAATAGAAAEPVPPAAEAPDPPLAHPAVHSAPTEPSGDVEVAPEVPAAIPAPRPAGSAASVPPRPPVPAPEPPVVREVTTLPLPPPASERRPHVPGRATGRPDDAPTPGPAVRAREPSRVPTEPATSPTAADTALVLDAMRRLRRGHDPQAALRELDAYLAQWPNGDLAEEVLALAIEARAGLADPAACSLAELYRQRYPRGRFRDAAEHAQRQLGKLQRCRPTD